MTNFLSGQRVRLKSDYTDEFSNSYKAGQTGTILSSNLTDNKALVDFDGYEEERQREAELWETVGEGSNIVSFTSLVPVELLEELGN